MIGLAWYGGKLSYLGWLLPLLPESHHFCEPFSGSAAVLLNRSPSPIETYNDLDGEVVNFFRMLRDDTDELIRLIKLTPVSREEFRNSCNISSELSNLERARLFFVRLRQSRFAKRRTTQGDWRWSVGSSAKGMSAVASSWIHSIDGLLYIATRLLRVQIENRPALEVIRSYDSIETLFYCDPPYPTESRVTKNVFGCEMSDEDHIELWATLSRLRGKVAISGYRCDLMDSLYKGWGLNEADHVFSGSTQTTKNKDRVKKSECLWMNY